MKYTLSVGNLYFISRDLLNVATEGANSQPVEPPLTRSELALMDFLIEQESPIAVQDIVKATGLLQSRVSGAIKSTASRGWVTVSQNQKDRRFTLVEAKPEVIKTAKEMRMVQAEFAIKKIAKNATDEELDIIMNGLNTLYEVRQRK